MRKGWRTETDLHVIRRSSTEATPLYFTTLATVPGNWTGDIERADTFATTASAERWIKTATKRWPYDWRKTVDVVTVDEARAREADYAAI